MTTMHPHPDAITTSTSTLVEDFGEQDGARALEVWSQRQADQFPNLPASVTNLIGARERLQELERTLYADLPRIDQQHLPLLDALVAGSDMPAALEESTETALIRQRRDIAQQQIRLTLTQVRETFRVVLAEAMPEVLAGLRADLDKLVPALRKAYTDVGDLDIQSPDPMDVAQATKAQQAALIQVQDLTKRYHRVRRLQLTALSSSALTVPGSDGFRVWGWADVIATGVAANRRPGSHTAPGAGMQARHAVRAQVERDDCWLPDPDELTQALAEHEDLMATDAREQAAQQHRARAEQEGQDSDAQAQLRAAQGRGPQDALPHPERVA